MFVDGEHYGDVNPGEGFYSTGRDHAVPHAALWLRGSIMAPLDQFVSSTFKIYLFSKGTHLTGYFKIPFFNKYL